MTKTRKNWLVLAFYSLFFLGLFSQFPLKNSIPGNCDTWYVISLSNTYLSEIAGFFTGEKPGVSMYPAESIFKFGESAPGSAALFIIFKLLGANDIWAYYFFISLIFILNAFGLYLVAEYYTKNTLAGIFAGFAFACSNFMFANIDDSVVFFYFLPLLALYFINHYIESQKGKYLVYFSFLIGMQVYFSVYVFVGQLFIFIVFCFSNFNFFINDLIIKKKRLIYLAMMLLFFIIISQTLFSYLRSISSKDFIDFYQEGAKGKISVNALNIENLIAVLPNNLLYHSDLKIEDLFIWCSIRLRAFTGYGVLALAIIGLFKTNSNKIREILFIILIGVLFAFNYFNKYLYYYLLPDIFLFFRVAHRFYFISCIGFSLLAAFGLSILIQKFQKFNKYAIAIFLVFFFTHFIENVTFPLMSYRINDLSKPTNSYLMFFNKELKSTLLNLPSNDITGMKTNSENTKVENGPLIQRIFKYNRETIYMNQQTYHKQNILNGNNGYYPKSRLKIQEYIENIPSQAAFDSLLTVGLDYIVFHKNFVLEGEENELRILKEQEKYLKLEFEDNDIAIFKVQK